MNKFSFKKILNRLANKREQFAPMDIPTNCWKTCFLKTAGIVNIELQHCFYVDFKLFLCRTRMIANKISFSMTCNYMRIFLFRILFDVYTCKSQVSKFTDYYENIYNQTLNLSALYLTSGENLILTIENTISLNCVDILYLNVILIYH